MPEPNTFTVVVAMLTPYRPDGTVDLDALRAHVDALVEEGVDAVMPCGTTGESPLLADAEVAQIIDTVVETAGGRVRVIAHVGRPTTRATVALGRAARAAGAGAVSAVTPYYYPVADEQLRSHYDSLIKALPGLPVFAYNIPARTGNDLRPEVVRTLADRGLAGLKDTTNSLDRHREYLAVADGRDFSVFVGSDEMVLEAMRAGSAGSVSAVANFAPRLLVGLKRAFLEDRDQDAVAIQKELAALRRRVTDGPALRGLKGETSRFMERRGVRYSPAVRPPL